MGKTILEKLEGCRLTKIRARAYKEQIEQIQTLLEHCTPSYAPRLESGRQPYNDDQRAGRLDKLAELRTALIYLECGAVEDIMDCYEALRSLPEQQRTAMELYYLSDKCATWEAVAKEMGYSERHVRLISERAKENLTANSRLK